MKMKMLILGAAAVAASLCAHALETSTVTFDGLAAGAFDATQAENGKYWWKSANESNGQIVANDGTYAGDRAVPAGATDNALEIEAEAPLYRGLTGVTDATDAFGEVPADGVFIDNLIQIGLQSEAPETLPEGVKFAVWGQIVTEDATEVEKLFVRAGKYTEGQLGSFDYEIAIPQGFDFDAWHRVTVKTTVKDNKTFFKFYIDGTLAKTKTSDETSEFPGLVEATTISAVAYQGNGLVDDIVVTESIPSFAGIVQVGDTYFEDLQAAINDVIDSESGDTLVMLQAVSAALTLPAGESISVRIPATFPASYDFGAMLTTEEGYEIQSNTDEVTAEYKMISFASVKSSTPVEETYDLPDGTTFTIDSTVAATLKTALGVDNLNATVTGKDFTYAQGYALGLVKENGTIEEVEPVISIKGNKITVGLATMPVNGYTVKFEIIAVGALNGFATVQKGTEYTANGNGETPLTVELDIVEGETAKFYKTKIVSISK